MRHRFKKHLNGVPPDYKMGDAYIGKTHKVTQIVCQELGLELARSKGAC